MIFNNETAKSIAQILLQINAIKLNLATPFTWASGWKSPIYCDNRILLSYPEHRDLVASNMASFVKNTYPNAQVIAGVATGAIGIGMLVAQKLNLPFIYVRPEPKKHGKGNQIEGVLSQNDNVVVIEDLISTGMSSLNTVSVLKNAGANVFGMVAIFSYGFDIAEQAFNKNFVTLHTLSDYNNLIKVAISQNFISQEQENSLISWRQNPENWSI